MLKAILLFFVGVNANLNEFMKTHNDISVPENIRGDNFTEENLNRPGCCHW